jgi:hypothetical protein
MDIKEVAQKKEELKKRISFLVDEFHKNTGITHIDVNASTKTDVRIGSGEEVVTDIKVDINLNL